MADIEKYVKMKEMNMHADVIRVTMENDGFLTPDDIEDFFINAEIFEPYFLLRWKKFGKAAIQKRLETDGFSPEDIENFFSWNYLRGRFAVQTAPKAAANHPAPGTLKLASMNYPMPAAPAAAPAPPAPQAPPMQAPMPPPPQMMPPPPAPAPPPDLNSMTVIERIKYEKAQKEAAAAQQKLQQQQAQAQQQAMYPGNQQQMMYPQQQQQQQMMYGMQPGAPQMMYGQQPMYGQQQMMYGQPQMMGGPPQQQQQQQAPGSGGVQSKMLESIRQARAAKEQAAAQAAAAAMPPAAAAAAAQQAAAQAAAVQAAAPPEPVVRAPPPPPPGTKRRPPGPGKKAPSRAEVEKYVKKFDKYVQMKNKNFSEATIRRKMGADGFDEDEVVHFLTGEYKYGPLYETNPGDEENGEYEEEQDADEAEAPGSPMSPKTSRSPRSPRSPNKNTNQSPRKKKDKMREEEDEDEDDLPPHELTAAEKNSNSKIQEFLEALLAAAFELQDPEEDDSKTFLTEHAADVLEKMLRSHRDTGGAPGSTPEERKQAVLAFLDTEGIRRHLDDAEITQNAIMTFFGAVRRQSPATERLRMLNSPSVLDKWADPDEAAGDRWLESLELTGTTKDKYDLYVKYVRDGENKDFIRGHMSAHGLSQKEIAAFFKAFPCGNGKSAQSKRGDRATTIPAYIPKPRVAGSGTPQVSPRLLDDASMEKNTAYFAEMARAERLRDELEMSKMGPDERKRYLEAKEEAKRHQLQKLAHHAKVNAVYYKASGANIALNTLADLTQEQIDALAAQERAANEAAERLLAGNSIKVEEKKKGGGCVIS